MGLFQQINGESRKRGLEFLVIGGLAVNMHGFMRDTADLDLLVRQESRDEWVNLFSELGYTLFRERPVFCQLDPPQAGAWPVDLMFVREPTFREIFNFGLTAEMFGERLLIPTLEHLVALKLHALKHGRIERYLKDYLDVEGLVRTNKIDLRQEKIRELFLKYGTLDVYEKISRTTARK
ncbi:MAG: hypothetical protein DME22_22295 [Verrucomicrobia bacterium]|nr:MAG: hypothetical protein DME22_22295 [Verrucomicrobiota bacterium]PYJ98098.1 MAG: hypothetical protein DME23_13045 [Verrucomicrobiota bacterium]